MLMLIRRFDGDVDGEDLDGLSLPYEIRQKSRFLAELADGTPVGVMLPRGQTLRHGDVLASEAGRLVRIEAAPERLSVARTDDALLMARACYHLGNRHVNLQIRPDGLSYPHDHVLDDMVSGLGLTVQVVDAPFEPEAGAYASGGHGHGHTHSH